MLEISQALSELNEEYHSIVLGLAEALLTEEAMAMPEFIKSSPFVLEKLPIGQLGRWYEEGINTLRQNRDGGLAFFKIESAHWNGTHRKHAGLGIVKTCFVGVRWPES